MGRWNQAQRDSRQRRIKKLKGIVFAGIMRALGRAEQMPCCMTCGTTRNLVVDHPNGRTWNVRKHNEETRWRIYKRELDAGVPLGILCQVHSGRDGRLRFQGRPRWRSPVARWTPDMAGPVKPLAISLEEQSALAEYLHGPSWM